LECFRKPSAAKNSPGNPTVKVVETTEAATEAPTTINPATISVENQKHSNLEEKEKLPRFSENERMSEEQREMFEQQIEDDLAHVEVRRLRFA
jgi:hypothetical protein